MRATSHAASVPIAAHAGATPAASSNVRTQGPERVVGEEHLDRVTAELDGAHEEIEEWRGEQRAR